MLKKNYLKENIIHTIGWELLTNTISYSAIFGIFYRVAERRDIIDLHFGYTFFTIAVVLHFVFSITRNRKLIVLGNLMFPLSVFASYNFEFNDNAEVILMMLLPIFIYSTFNTTYQILMSQRDYTTKGLAFITMHLIKGLTIFLHSIFLSRLFDMYSLESITKGPMGENNDYISLYMHPNLCILVANFFIAIVQLFARNAELSKLSHELKQICSWSIDEKVIENDVLNGKIQLRTENRAILFGDIRGFTAFTEKNDVKSVAKILLRFYQDVEKIVQNHKGFKPEFIADEFVTFFSDARSAVNCALEIRKDINEKLSKYGLSLGQGLHKGFVLEGILGGENSRKYSIIGNPANITSRLQLESKGNQILCSEEIVNSVKELKVKRIYGIRLKGVSADFKIYEIRGLKPDSLSQIKISGIKKIINPIKNRIIGFRLK